MGRAAAFARPAAGEMVDVGPQEIVIARERIIAVLGYPRAANIDPHFDDIIAKVIATAAKRIAPRAGYTILPVNHDVCRHAAINVGTVRFAAGPVVTAKLRMSTETALFAGTIGPGMEQWAGELFAQGDPVTGHIVDAVASEAVEQLANLLHHRIAAASAARGLFVTNRYSPGYCHWPVAEQQLFFSLLPSGFCGISVSSSALMLPVKSVSGIVGIGASVTREPYDCDRCNSKQCTWRAFCAGRQNKGETS
jgi:hypothetical protein